MPVIDKRNNASIQALGYRSVEEVLRFAYKPGHKGHELYNDFKVAEHWNPLNSDAECLENAVRCGVGYELDKVACRVWSNGFIEEYDKTIKGDVNRAVRLVMTLACADKGKKMYDPKPE